MKFTLSWLKDHLDTDAGAEEIAARLTALGLEVEDIEDRARDLAAFTVGRVVRCEPHPNADKLKVCLVDTGREEVQVICGAPNARAGMKGVFAPAGTHIPGTGVDLKTSSIRGVESRGMLCSERELGLSDEHTGIVDLDPDAPVGAPFARVYWLDDPVIDVSLTPDRADCAGVLGIARDLAAAGLGHLRPAAAEPVPGAYPSPIGVAFDFPESLPADPCPLFVGRHIRGVRNGPSPRWLQEKLLAIGLRPISALVDVTNFFTVDRARPLHVFDAGRIAGDLVLRLGEGGERLEALNDKTYEIPPGATVICDDAGVQSLAGVIGGAPTGCTEDTVDVFLEVALFDPVRTADTGRALQIDSDARYRFERGVDPDAVLAGAEAATRMILDLCGGEASELVVTGAVPDWRRTVPLRPDRAESLGGVAVPRHEQLEILRRLGCAVSERADGPLLVEPPSWRGDIEGEADLVEEVLRIYGYESIPAVSMPRASAIPQPALTPRQRQMALVRRALAARGLDEAVTWSFMDGETAARFGLQHRGLTLLNPIASDLDVMRPSVLPNLIRAAGRNAARGFPDAALCEVGPAYRDPSPTGQRLVAAGVRSGSAVPRHWAGGARAPDAYDAKADAVAALEAAGAPAANAVVSADAPDWFHPGRSGCLRLGATVLAHFGEVHPAVLQELDVPGPVAAFEAFLDAIPRAKRKPGTAKPLLKLSPFQPVVRDFAFVVDEGVPADAVLRAARGGDKKLIADVALFDVYRGAGVPEGSKSLAVAVTLQPLEATLTEEEIEAVGRRIVANVEKQTGGSLRG
jgi:phenylalanyl-tRNA synthetase beta chain